jgi:hypothetical protein
LSKVIKLEKDTIMNYEIKIKNAPEANGTIDILRLATIADGISKISQGALQIRLRGVSLTKGRKKVSLKGALKVSLTNIKKGSTVLCLESEKFGKTLEPYQTDIFLQEAQHDLPEQTPVSLFIKAFQDATVNEYNFAFLDKPLLKELKQFKKAFSNDNEVFIISNQASVPDLELKMEDFNKIKVLEEEIPEPETTILNGIVDELKYSKLKVRIKTIEGIVDGFLSDNLSSSEIAHFWGKEVTITGTKHFKPGGKSIIEIEHVYEASEGDKYFSKKPKFETVEQQIKRQIRQKAGNRFSEIVGKWPGNEDFDDLTKMLTK